MISRKMSLLAALLLGIAGSTSQIHAGKFLLAGETSGEKNYYRILDTVKLIDQIDRISVLDGRKGKYPKIDIYI